MLLLSVLSLPCLLGRLQAAEPATWTTGHKKVLIIPVKFTDDPGPSDSPGTNGKLSHWGEIADGTMTAQISNFIAHQSYGKCTMEFTVLPLIDMGVSYTIYNQPLDSDSAATKFTRWSEPGSLASDVRNRARAIGLTTATPALYDTDNFDLDIIATGFIPGQGFYATSVTHGKGVYANLFTALPHELCHNLGLSHAQGVSRGTTYVPLPRNSFFSDKYGNVFDLMGDKDTDTLPLMPDRDAGAYWKFALGWLSAANIATVTTSGTYRIYPIDIGTINVGHFHAMRIQRDPTHTYWFEYRQNITGADSRWTDSGLLVQFGAESYQAFAGNTYMLDTTPGSRGLSGSTFPTMHDAPLQAGCTFSDGDANIHVTPIRKAGTTPESLDVIVNLGPFPGNRAPTLSITPATVASLTAGTLQEFTATASDPDGDSLAYYWEFDDPDAPAGVAFGGSNPDTRLATTASHTWSRKGTYLVRCTATDMKGGKTIKSALVTVTTGSTARLYINGTIKDENGNPIQGAIVNNFNILNANDPIVDYGSANFTASGVTDASGRYAALVPESHTSGNTYKLSIMYEGYTFTPETTPNITYNPVWVGTNSVSGKNFIRTRGNRTIAGPIALAGIFYDPAIHGNITFSTGNQTCQLNTVSPTWSFTVADDTLINLTATPDNPAVTLHTVFSNPTRIFTNNDTFYFAVRRPGYLPEAGFTTPDATSDDTVGTVNIPVTLNLPSTHTTWPAQQDFNIIIDPSSTAEYGVDYKMSGGQITWYGSKVPATRNLPLKIIPTGQPKTKTVVIKLTPNSTIANIGATSTFTYTITNPDPLPAFHAMIAEVFPGETNPAIISENADPDNDSLPNILEFALHGQPHLPENSSLLAAKISDCDPAPGDEFTCVVSFRRGATFTAQPDGSQKNSSAVDGIHCTIQGSNDLATYNQAVRHQGPFDTLPGHTDLTGTDWEYHSFYMTQSPSFTRLFLRAVVSSD